MKSVHTAKASFTVEASLIIPVVFVSVVSLIIGGFKLHDIVASNLIANEAAELYGHHPESIYAEDIEAYGNSRLGAMLSGKGSLALEEAGNGSRVAIESSGGQRVYTDSGSRPEKTMRKLTVIEEVFDGE